MLWHPITSIWLPNMLLWCLPINMASQYVDMTSSPISMVSDHVVHDLQQHITCCYAPNSIHMPPAHKHKIQHNHQPQFLWPPYISGPSTCITACYCNFQTTSYNLEHVQWHHSHFTWYMYMCMYIFIWRQCTLHIESQHVILTTNQIRLPTNMLLWPPKPCICACILFIWPQTHSCGLQIY